MNHSQAPDRGRSISPLFLAPLALAAACSGYYPLGDSSDATLALEGDGATGQVDVRDGHVPAGLAPPEITMAVSRGEPGLGTLAGVGDLDGDGRDEMAVSAIDFPTPFAFVQLRYGGPRPKDEEQKFAFAHSGAFLVRREKSWQAPDVTAAGDIDGDGYGDLLIRTEDCDTTGPGEGAYLIYGSPERLEGTISLASVAVRFVPSERTQNPPPGYGLTCSASPPLAPAGDLDGDGIDDLVITREPINDSMTGDALLGTGEGVYLFYGRNERFSGEVPLERADAIFHSTIDRVQAFPRGDINGDGLADLIVGADAYRHTPPGSFLLAGRGERFSGRLALEQNATLLAGAYVTTGGWPEAAGDLDGDGLTDVLLFDDNFQRHLFYGAPGLFADGLDFSQADASIGATAGYVYPIGDRDGDGDDELIDQFFDPNVTDLQASIFSANVAFASGSKERLSGTVPFPESEVMAGAPDGPFPDQKAANGDFGRTLLHTIPAGDLDGDGADELFATSGYYELQSTNTYQVGDIQLHVYFGVPARAASALR